MYALSLARDEPKSLIIITSDDYKKKEKVEYRNICISRHGEATAGVPVFSLISSFSPLYLLIPPERGMKE